jgi:hypothetical protein
VQGVGDLSLTQRWGDIVQGEERPVQGSGEAQPIDLAGCFRVCRVRRVSEQTVFSNHGSPRLSPSADFPEIFPITLFSLITMIREKEYKPIQTGRVCRVVYTPGGLPLHTLNISYSLNPLAPCHASAQAC